MDRQNPQTNGKSKAIQRKSCTEAYTYILKKRKRKRKIYINKKMKRTTKSISKFTTDNKL